jgi:hypothetical protein
LLHGLLIAGVVSHAHASGVHVALTPSLVQVEPGTEFDLRIMVTQAGSAFDSYHAVVAYDPQVLAFVQRPASVQEGSSMEGVCGSTFHYFVASAFEVDISHALVCSGQSLVGPGELYVLRFRATAQAQATDVFFTQLEFALAGVPVAVASSDPATIRIDEPSHAGENGVAALDWTMTPNPMTSTAVLRIDTSEGRPDLIEIFDVRGRSVHRSAWGAATRYVWTPRDVSGVRLPAGIYFVRVGNRDQSFAKRVTLLD